MTPPAPAPTLRLCVVMPAFNCAAVVGPVARGAAQHGWPVLAVDDGSTDDTAAQLHATPGVTVLRLPHNQGKGVALRTGLRAARRAGFTHAITLDSDGQHDPADLPAMAHAAVAHPGHLILGVRDLRGAGARLKSRALRVHSDWWCWVCTGRWPGDSQSGLRVYPLRLLGSLHLTSRRYDFEVEALVKAVWCGAGLARVPVRVHYHTGCPSHFRPWQDFLRVSRLNVRLVALSLLTPPATRRVWVRRGSARLRQRHGPLRATAGLLMGGVDDPRGAGAAVALGLAVGVLPIWGAQMLVAAAAARAARLNPAVALAASNISFGGLAGIVVMGSTALGRLVLHGSTTNLWHLPRDLPQARGTLVEYLVGSVLLAALLALGGGLLTAGLVWLWRRWRSVA